MTRGLRARTPAYIRIWMRSTARATPVARPISSGVDRMSPAELAQLVADAMPTPATMERSPASPSWSCSEASWAGVPARGSAPPRPDQRPRARRRPRPGCPTGRLSLAMIRSLSSWTLGEASSRLSSAGRRLSPGAHLRHHGGLVVRRLRSRRRAAPAPRRPIYGSNPRRVEAWAAPAWRRMRVSPQKLAVMPASTAAD